MKIFYFFYFFTFSAFSSERLNICDNCFNYADFELNAASGRIINEEIVKVLNPKTGEIKKFTITIENEPGMGFIIHKQMMPLTADELHYAKQAQQGLAQIIEFFDANKNVPVSYSASALDIIGYSRKINQISMYYNQKVSSGQVFSLYLESLLSLGVHTVLDIQVNIDAEFYFSDGSKAVMRVNKLSVPRTGQIIVFELIEVWDSEGNNVPTNQSEFEQRAGDIYHAVTAETMIQLLNLSHRYGISTLNFSRESFGGGGSVTIKDCNTASNCKIKEK